MKNTGGARQGFQLKEKTKKNIFIVGMLAVAIANFLVFWFYLNFNSILLAFKEKQANGSYTLTLNNFVKLFQEFGNPDGHFRESIANTLIFFFFSLLIILPISILISYFIYKKIRLYKFYRVTLFLPSIISAVVLTVVFKNFIHTDGGPLIPMLETLGVKGISTINFLGDSRYAIPTILVYTFWVGFSSNIILFGGAMSRVPEDVLESARIDGAGMPRELFSIILPMIWPTISTILILGVVGIFGSSGPILLLTQGNYKTYTVSYWIFDQVYNYYNFEYASAIGLFFTLIGVPLVFLVKRFLGKIGDDVEY